MYATVEEALSCSVADIEAYLLRLKKDLHIGEAGYPTQVTIAGDQHTYALMKEIQRKYPDRYSWMLVLHGDWHMHQLVAQEIRHILWDGGLKQLSHACGHKKLPTQWQEIHMLLLALHETLYRTAVLEYSSIREPHLVDFHNFKIWMDGVSSATNSNDTSRFWARMIPVLNTYVGYYISIRSGNRVLRNSCLRALLPLIFAYNHNQYEELCTTAIMDTLTLSDDVLKQFISGGWTVSVKGRPFHNLALDEAHESVINLRLKTITSRPSYFRTVELSNFMAYLDKVVRGLEEILYIHKQNEHTPQRRRFVCQRCTKMLDIH